MNGIYFKIKCVLCEWRRLKKYLAIYHLFLSNKKESTILSRNRTLNVSLQTLSLCWPLNRRNITSMPKRHVLKYLRVCYEWSILFMQDIYLWQCKYKNFLKHTCITNIGNNFWCFPFVYYFEVTWQIENIYKYIYKSIFPTKILKI